MSTFIKLVDYYSETINYVRKDYIFNIQTYSTVSGFFIKYFLDCNDSTKVSVIVEKFDTEEKMNIVLSSVLKELNEFHNGDDLC